MVPHLPGGGGPLQDGLTPALPLGAEEKKLTESQQGPLNPLECEQARADMSHKMPPSSSRIPILVRPWARCPARPQSQEAGSGVRWPWSSDPVLGFPGWGALLAGFTPLWGTASSCAQRGRDSTPQPDLYFTEGPRWSMALTVVGSRRCYRNQMPLVRKFQGEEEQEQVTGKCLCLPMDLQRRSDHSCSLSVPLSQTYSCPQNQETFRVGSFGSLMTGRDFLSVLRQ